VSANAEKGVLGAHKAVKMERTDPKSALPAARPFKISI